MTDLREKIAREIVEFMPSPGYGDAFDEARKVADGILAIPEIADALLLMNTATRRYVEATRQADPADYMRGLQNSHPWANLLRAEDLPPDRSASESA